MLQLSALARLDRHALDFAPSLVCDRSFWNEKRFPGKKFAATV